ncbi:MAG: hypothetical protein NE328_01360 [Lentisphaeraceae bacterium]|nr:hypothetical protein [Lentisphaeraceae bacterium]
MKLFTILLSLLVVSSCSKSPKENNAAEEKSNTSPVSKTSSGKAEIIEFWQLISQGKVESAIQNANSLVTGVTGESDHFHKPLFKAEGVKETFLVRKNFNKVDAFFWHQAQFFKSFSKEALTSSKDPVETFYDKVVANITLKRDVQDIGSYPFHIWQRGFGAGDRQAWVICELVYQLGGNASIIYLIDSETKVSPHTICEVVYNKKHYVIDIMNKKFLPDTKFTDLTPDKIKEIWSDKPKLHNTFEKAVRLIPSMPIDYTERNQRLNARLGKIIRFGEPPQNRYHFWKGIYPSMDIRFWEYPIRILKNTNFYIDAEK